jgi:glycosyltransferase involved in cell wall biosynthesis
MPRVSVVMPIYNAGRFLREAIDSVLNQSFRDLELIAVNDCSTDNSLSILRSYQDPRVRIVSNEKNLGVAASINIGITNSCGEYISRIDADDVAHPKRLEKQVKFLDDHPDIALVGSSAHIIDQLGKQIYILEVPTDGRTIKETLLKYNLFIHSSITFRRESFFSVGPYRPDFEPAEDYDLFLRFSERYSLANMSEPLVKYRVHTDQVSLKKIRKQRRIADFCKQMALDRIADRGGSVKRSDFLPSWWRRLQGREGSIGCDFLHWARIYRSTDQITTTRSLAIKAFFYSPLSTEARMLLSSITLQSLLSAEQIRAFRWYRRKLKMLFKGN